MRQPTYAFPVAAALLLLCAAPLGCAPSVVYVQSGPRGSNVPFRGTYVKFAESTFKNGQRIRVANANGAASVRIESGKVTYDQTYVTRGAMKRVSQLYTFRAGDVHAVPGGYEVVMTFQGMAGNTDGYSPDRNNPRLEVHQSPAGWQVDLFTTDNNGVIGVLELQ